MGGAADQEKSKDMLVFLMCLDWSDGVVGCGFWVLGFGFCMEEVGG